MSRSWHGEPNLTKEYWGKRPCAGRTPGKQTKRWTHRLERLEAKRFIRKTLLEMDWSYGPRSLPKP